MKLHPKDRKESMLQRNFFKKKKKGLGLALYLWLLTYLEHGSRRERHVSISVWIISFSHYINDCVPIRLLYYGWNYINFCTSFWLQYLLDSLPHSRHSINIIEWLSESLRSQEFLFCPIVYPWWKTASLILIKLIKYICYCLQEDREWDREEG